MWIIAVVGGVALVYTDARLGSGPGRITACGEDQRMEVGPLAAFAFQDQRMEDQRMEVARATAPSCLPRVCIPATEPLSDRYPKKEAGTRTALLMLSLRLDGWR